MKKFITIAIALGALAITAQSSVAGGCGIPSYAPVNHYPTYVAPTYTSYATYTTHCNAYQPFYVVKVQVSCDWFIKYSGYNHCQAKSVANFYNLHGHFVKILTH